MLETLHCCTGHRQLLVLCRAADYFNTHTDRRTWCCNGCRIRFYAFRQKNIPYAAQHHAKCHFSTDNRRHCPFDKIYLKRNLYQSISRCLA